MGVRPENQLLAFIFLTLAMCSLPAFVSGAADQRNETGADATISTELENGWRLIRTPNPKGGPDAISVTHVADTSRSDLDLVGLMVRCTQGKLESLVAVLSALPASAHPQVKAGNPGDEAEFQASVAAPGTLVLLPEPAMKMLQDKWKEQDLSVSVENGGTTIRGVIKLAGFVAASNKLQKMCDKH